MNRNVMHHLKMMSHPVALFVVTLWVSLALTGEVHAQNFRKWTSGKFSVEAKYLGFENDAVILETREGKKLTVPLERLSPIDQGYVEGRRTSGGGGDANPFQEMKGDSGSSASEDSGSTSSATGAGGIREYNVDFTDCLETPISKGNWAPTIGEQPEIPIRLKNFAISGQRDFWEKTVRVTFNVYAKRAVLTYHLGRHGKPVVSRMEMIDLETGRVIGNASGDGRWTAFDIHDDGVRVVVQNMSDDEATKGQMGTVELKGKKIVPLDLWTPYSEMEAAGKEKVVTFAKFLNNNRLLTLSQNGRAVIWDFATRKPVRRFNYHGACQPSLSHDRKQLAICGGDIFGMVDLEDDSVEPSVTDAPQLNYWINTSFSPSCKRFAAANMNKVMVWDVATGDVLFDGKIPGIMTKGTLTFPHEDFIMVGGDHLIEIDSKIKLWKYNGGLKKMVHGQMLLIHREGKGGRIMPSEIPHQAALDILAEAKSQSDLFILKKGAGVNFDLSGVSGQWRGDVEQSLKENIERMGFTYSPSAKVTLKATIKGPEQDAVSYHFAGSFVVTKYTSQLNINYEGKSLWGQNATNVPGMVSGRDKAGIKKQLEKAGRTPNIKFFAGANLPEYLQKPTEGQQNNRDQQMLGASSVNLNGIN